MECNYLNVILFTFKKVWFVKWRHFYYSFGLVFFYENGFLLEDGCVGLVEGHWHNKKALVKDY